MHREADGILIRRYLFGDLSEEDRNRIEDEYLAPPDRYEELLAAENDLVDAYVRGELAEDENRRFESGYLGTPERGEKVEFARALYRASSRVNEVMPIRGTLPGGPIWEALTNQQRVPRWVLAASIVGLAGIGTWLIVSDHNLRAGLQSAQARQAELQREEDVLRQHDADLQRAPENSEQGRHQRSETFNSTRTSESLLALSLVPGSMRGPGSFLSSLHLPYVELVLFLGQDNHKTYKAELQNADGERILQSTALLSQNREGKMQVTWRIPARLVQPGDYVVQLKGLNERGGLEEVESYSFRALTQ